MKENVLKFKNDIKSIVAKHKQTGYCYEWMHPMYCAYYILKHPNVNKDDFIKFDIERSYKALPDDYYKKLFARTVNDIYEKYAAETTCIDK